MRTRSLLILFVLAVFGSCISEDADKGSQGANLVVGDSLPTFQVTMNDGSTVSTADLLGSVSVVVFFSVDCGDCRVELPEVQRLWDLQLGIPIVLIARENTEEAETNLDMPLFFVERESVRNLNEDYVQGQPASMSSMA